MSEHSSSKPIADYDLEFLIKSLEAFKDNQLSSAQRLQLSALRELRDWRVLKVDRQQAHLACLRQVVALSADDALHVGGTSRNELDQLRALRDAHEPGEPNDHLRDVAGSLPAHDERNSPKATSETAKDIERRLIVAIQEADRAFEKAGAAGTKHWIREFLLPRLEAHGLGIGDKSRLPPPPDDRRDAERYRFLCANPDWQFIEKLCQQFAAKHEDEFKRGLDAAIDRVAPTKNAPRGKPCTCSDTSKSACGVEQGSRLGELWYCRRAHETSGWQCQHGNKQIECRECYALSETDPL